MARPKRTFTEEARRAQIITCAIDTLADLGYVKTSLAQIAKCANISTSVVSYYFAGKDDLMKEVINEVYSKAAEFMGSALDPALGAKALLRSYIESNLAYGRDHARELKALAEIVIHWLAEPGKLPDGGSNDSILKPLEEILQWGQETGEFRSFNTRVMAVTIRKAMDGTLEQLNAHSDTDMEVYAKELVTLFDLATRQES